MKSFYCRLCDYELPMGIGIPTDNILRRSKRHFKVEHESEWFAFRVEQETLIYKKLLKIKNTSILKKLLKGD